MVPIRNKTPKQILRLLRDNGWVVAEQEGSHIQLRHSLKPQKVTIPWHKGTLTAATIHSILRQAGLKDE
ncbi:MAG: type II toxin-antitoxin system HicA family toxin [Chloroflexota bacterium]